MNNQDDQRKVFKRFWPDECWHKADPNHEDECVNCKCFFQRPHPSYEPYNCEDANPDLLTAEWQNRMLDRLVQMGYDYEVHSIGRNKCVCKIYSLGGNNSSNYRSEKDELPQAVFEAALALVEKEGV